MSTLDEITKEKQRISEALARVALRYSGRSNADLPELVH